MAATSTSNIVLNLPEIVALVKHLAANPNIVKLLIFQKATSGIGVNTFVRCYTQDGKYQEIEITDYGVW